MGWKGVGEGVEAVGTVRDGSGVGRIDDSSGGDLEGNVGVVEGRGRGGTAGMGDGGTGTA